MARLVDRIAPDVTLLAEQILDARNSFDKSGAPLENPSPAEVIQYAKDDGLSGDAVLAVLALVFPGCLMPDQVHDNASDTLRAAVQLSFTCNEGKDNDRSRVPK